MRKKHLNKPALKDFNPIINVLIHHFDFAEDTNDTAVFDLTRLDELLSWINKQQDISCIPLSQSAAILASYSPKKTFAITCDSNKSPLDYVGASPKTCCLYLRSEKSSDVY